MLPSSIATPWIQVAEAIGTRPVSTYCSTAMFNFRLINPQEPITLEYAPPIPAAIIQT